MTDNGNAEGSPPEVAKPDRVPAIMGWAFGILAIAFGLTSFLAGAGRVGWALLALGLLLWPLAAKALRTIHPIFRKTGVPTFTAIAAGVLVFAVNPLAGAGSLERKSPSTNEAVAASSAATTTAPESQAGPKIEIVGEGDPMRPAQDALNRGEVTAAVTAYFSSAVPQERRASPEGQRLRAAIQAAMDRGTGAEPSEREARAFAAALRSLRALEDLSSTATVGEVWQRLDVFEETARVLEEHPELGLAENALSERERLKTALGQRQISDFPAMRKAYGETMRRNLWEQDIAVEVSGERITVISYTGTRFATNRNVAQAQQGAAPHLQKLRFARSRYSWSAGDDAWAYYDLTQAGDETVGYWQGGQFTEVS